jgi:hypothetical protein
MLGTMRRHFLFVFGITIYLYIYYNSINLWKGKRCIPIGYNIFLLYREGPSPDAFGRLA